MSIGVSERPPVKENETPLWVPMRDEYLNQRLEAGPFVWSSGLIPYGNRLLINLPRASDLTSLLLLSGPIEIQSWNPPKERFSIDKVDGQGSATMAQTTKKITTQTG